MDSINWTELAKKVGARVDARAKAAKLSKIEKLETVESMGDEELLTDGLKIVAEFLDIEFDADGRMVPPTIPTIEEVFANMDPEYRKRVYNR